MGKLMKLKRADVCFDCGTDVPAGTEAYWLSAERVVRCVGCYAAAGDTREGDRPRPVVEHGLTLSEASQRPLAATDDDRRADIAGGSAQREHDKRSARELAKKQQKVDEDAEWRQAIRAKRPLLGPLVTGLTPKPKIGPESQATAAWKDKCPGVGWISMLRVTTLHASSAAATASYYTNYLAKAPGEVPGVWTGRQAAGLGLSGTVDAGALQSLLEGRDPGSGTQLGYPLLDRVLTDGRVVRAVAGFDATFSAPKSLSVLWALTQDRRLLDAHDAAVTAALTHLERFGSTTRVRADGRRLHPDSEGLTIATFRQTTSRADDPQIHTHAVVSAKVQTTGGRWLALDARYLKRHQRMLGGLYQSVLRNELAHRFGVAWEPIVNGQAEIVGMPAELLEVFSKRTSQVDAALETKLVEFRNREGRDPSRWERAALTREAAADTRGHKTGNAVTDLTTRWATEAQTAGWAATDLVDRVRQAGRAVDSTSPANKITAVEMVEALSVSSSCWTRADVLRAICDAARSHSGYDGRQWAASLERAADSIIAGCVELDPSDAAAPRRRSDGRSLWLEPTSPHITSDRVLAQEDFVISWAMEAQDATPSPYRAGRPTRPSASRGRSRGCG